MTNVARWHRKTRSRAWLKGMLLATFRLVSCMLLPRPALLNGHKRIYSKHGSLVYNETPWNKYCRKQNICDRVLFSPYKTCTVPERQWPLKMLSAFYDGSRCHRIRQFVNWRANKQQDLETIELRFEALFLMSVSRVKAAVNWCLVGGVTPVFAF